MRYRVVYSKSQPCSKWCNKEYEALDFARRMRSVGYSVDVFIYDENGGCQLWMGGYGG